MITIIWFFFWAFRLRRRAFAAPPLGHGPNPSGLQSLTQRRCPNNKPCPKTNAFPVIFHRACMRRFHSKMQTPDNDETLFSIISLFDDTIVVLLMSNNQSRRNDQNEILYIFFYEQNAEHGIDPLPRSS